MYAPKLILNTSLLQGRVEKKKGTFRTTKLIVKTYLAIQFDAIAWKQYLN